MGKSGWPLFLAVAAHAPVRRVLSPYEPPAGVSLYELASANEYLALAAALDPLRADRSPVTALAAGAARPATVSPPDYAALRCSLCELKDLLEYAIADGAGRAPLAPAVSEAVLTYTARRASRERGWHRGSGLDPDGPHLPPLAPLSDNHD